MSEIYKNTAVIELTDDSCELKKNEVVTTYINNGIIYLYNSTSESLKDSLHVINIAKEYNLYEHGDIDFNVAIMNIDKDNILAEELLHSKVIDKKYEKKYRDLKIWELVKKLNIDINDIPLFLIVYNNKIETTQYNKLYQVIDYIKNDSRFNYMNITL